VALSPRAAPPPGELPALCRNGWGAATLRRYARNSRPSETGVFSPSNSVAWPSHNSNVADDPFSVEARCLYKKGKRIEREVIRQTVPEQAKPAFSLTA
jgi:hypothetical protein